MDENSTGFKEEPMAYQIRHRAPKQGFLQQTPSWTRSPAIMHFRMTTAWVEYGRILLVNERTGQFWSCDWKTWLDRAIQLIDNADQMRSLYPDQANQMESMAGSMFRLGKIARAQPQPAFLFGNPSIDRKVQLLVPGTDARPVKKLIVPGTVHAQTS